MVEPLGLLWGDAARQAIAVGLALPLAGGPAALAPAFTMARHADQVLPARQAADAWPGPVRRLSEPVPDWAGLGLRPLVMGILNVTPDSFSDGGVHRDPARAVDAGLQMLADGADLLDIGGESTRPGATLVPPGQEQARILPVIAALARAGAVISVDTRNASTMQRALDAGARIVNDVSALAWDPESAATVARAGCPVILMHMRGTPATMQSLAAYDDVAAEVTTELAASIAAAEAAGVAPHHIAIDCGFGFAKTPCQSLALLRRLPALAALGRPILAGLSRKSVIGQLTGLSDPASRDPASLAAHLHALAQGARLIRTHEVAQTRQAVTTWQALHQIR